MNIQQIRTKNLLELAKKYNGLKNLADACGKNNAYFSQIFSETRPFTEKFARQIEETLNLEIGYLDKPITENKNTLMIEIPEYNAKLSAGNGECLSARNIVAKHSIPRDLLLTYAGDINKLYILSVSGDSMEPLLNNGAKILINTDYPEFIENKIYAFLLKDKLFIKRLFTDINNNRRIITHSENNSYKDQTINISEMKIIGIAICSIGNAL